MGAHRNTGRILVIAPGSLLREARSRDTALPGDASLRAHRPARWARGTGTVAAQLERMAQAPLQPPVALDPGRLTASLAALRCTPAEAAFFRAGEAPVVESGGPHTFDDLDEGYVPRTPLWRALGAWLREAARAVVRELLCEGEPPPPPKPSLVRPRGKRSSARGGHRTRARRRKKGT